MAGIVIASGERRGERYSLGRRTNVIGRAESLAIQILDDRVSRKHLQIRFDGVTGRYSAVDMGSRNGVFVNGVRIATEAVLSDRDLIHIGDTVLLYTQQDADIDEALLHRYKKPGEARRPTQANLQIPTAAPARDHCWAVGRDSRGILVRL